VGFGFGVWGFRFGVSGFRFRVSGFRFRVSGFGFRVSGIGQDNQFPRSWSRPELQPIRLEGRSRVQVRAVCASFSRTKTTLKVDDAGNF